MIDTVAEIVQLQHIISAITYSWTICEEKKKKRKVTIIREIIDGNLLSQNCLFCILH